MVIQIMERISFADSVGREDWLFRLGKRYLKGNVPVKEGGQFAEMFYTSLIDGSSSFSCKLEYTRINLI